MTLEELARQHRTLMRDDYGREVAPCPPPAYERAKTRFKSKFGFELPDAYWVVMSVCNGIRFNGMTICPAVQSPGFRETLEQFNEDLRDSLYSRFIFLGQRDEELYVWDETRRMYCATEFSGRPIWREFSSAEEMFTFLLRRGLDHPPNE
jgi:hypothetical protein